MASTVYFAEAWGGEGGTEPIPGKAKALWKKAGFDEIIAKKDLVAVKLHFGEPGNVHTVHPFYVREIVELIKAAGGMPFVTDTNVLYRGKRNNSVDHLLTAYHNGFNYATLGAPVIISDGLKGKSFFELPTGGRRCPKAKIAADIVEADALVVLTHVTGHCLFGLGGAIKNLAMGTGSPGGKQMMHSDVKPTAEPEKCVGCRLCAKWCPVDAISFPDGKAVVDHDKCIGCGECTALCPQTAFKIQWGETVGLQERSVEFAAALTRQKAGKIAYLSYALRITADCDCGTRLGHPIVPDIGILASRDVVAIDQATVDLVKAQPAIAAGWPNGAAPGKGKDKFGAANPSTDYTVQLKYGEQMKLGTRKYELKRI